jgi:hypothetical protein
VPPAARAPLGPGQAVADLDLHVLDALHDQLRDALASRDLDVVARVGVDEEDLELAAVAAVEQAGRVEARDAVAQRQPAPRLDEPGVALRDRQGESGGDDRTSTAGLQHDPLACEQVEAGVARLRVRRQRQVGIESLHRDREHRRPMVLVRAGTLASCSPGWTSR